MKPWSQSPHFLIPPHTFLISNMKKTLLIIPAQPNVNLNTENCVLVSFYSMSDEQFLDNSVTIVQFQIRDENNQVFLTPEFRYDHQLWTPCICCQSVVYDFGQDQMISHPGDARRFCVVMEGEEGEGRVSMKNVRVMWHLIRPVVDRSVVNDDIAPISA